MPSDITRPSDDVRQLYGPPVLQQGRVILDRDFNALQQTLSAGLAQETLDVIGPCGTPDNGFQISLGAPAGSIGWSPIDPPSSPPSETYDFFISPGTMYVGGQRAVLPDQAPNHSSPPSTICYSYNNQPDWRTPLPPAQTPAQEAISLLLREQEVSAVEDPDLLDVALGGPDTTQRLRLIRRIERTSGNTCSASADAWAGRGYNLDSKSMRLLPQVSLQVSPISSQQKTDPCDPVAQGGYLGAENQLIRVQIRKVNSKPVLLWSYDNASFIYRVSIIDDTPTLKLAQSPVDAFHYPIGGQTVEILRTASILADDPGATDPTGQKKILRCIAEPFGFVSTLNGGYNATSATVQLNDPLPSGFADDPQLFLRVWQAQTILNSPSPQTIPLNDVNGNTTGLQVTLTLPQGASEWPEGAYWMFAVRPFTPQAVYPERFLLAPQPPDGPRLWLCPLAVIDWTASPPAVIDDCRSKFCDLVCLTERERASCCRYRVGDGVNTFGDFNSIQAAIDSLPTEGGEICILAGRYFEEISINKLADIIIHGCGAETRIASLSLKPNSDATDNAAVITITNSARIELRGFAVEPAEGVQGIFIGDDSSPETPNFTSTDISLRDLIVIGTTDSAIFMTGASLSLEGSTVAMQNLKCANPAVYAAGNDIHIIDNWVGEIAFANLPSLIANDINMPQDSNAPDPVVLRAFLADTQVNSNDRVATCGGIQIGGFSSDVHVAGNRIRGGHGNGITLGSVSIFYGVGRAMPEILFRKNLPPLDPCEPGTYQFPDPPTTLPPGGRWVADGPINRLQIVRNCIREMGLAGIGPVGFFDLETIQEIVSISHLLIAQNEIIHCPNARVGNTEKDETQFLGYAGISLPDVSDAVIRDNKIVESGASWIDPVSGIFVLHGEQIEISRNHIIDSRNWQNVISARALSARAGIAISMVSPPENGLLTSNINSSVSQGLTTEAAAQNPATAKVDQPSAVAGVKATDSSQVFIRPPAFVEAQFPQIPLFTPAAPALSIFDNVVRVPLGMSLYANGVGAFSIRGNFLATSGIAGQGSRTAAIGVSILNLGIPIDPESASLLKILETLSTILAKSLKTEGEAKLPSSLLNLGPGPVLFSQNRCCVDLSNVSRENTDKTISFCSTLIASLDDIGFNDNQCIVLSNARQLLTDVVLLGYSLRATGNRVQEYKGSMELQISLLTAAFENITALNITASSARSFGPSVNATSVNTSNF